MKLHLGGTVLLVVASAASWHQGSEYRATDSQGASERLEGVCSPKPNEIRCWDPAGKYLPGLSQRLAAYYTVKQEAIPARFKDRTLMIVFSQLSGPKPGGVGFTDVSVQPGGRLNQIVFLSPGGTGSDWFTGYWFYPPDDLKSVDIEGSLRSYQTGPLLPLKAGAQVQILGATLRIVKVQKEPGGPNTSYVRGPLWSASYEMTPDPKQNVNLEGVTPVDPQGRPIQYSDLHGNPLPAPVGEWGSAMPPPLQPKCWIFTVDPSKIANLSVMWSLPQPVTFRGVRLEESGS